MINGENMLAMVNPSSGLEGQDSTEDIHQAWPQATLLHTDPDTDIYTQLTAEIQARAGNVHALAVAGGDGTVAAVAAVAAEHHLPVALIPAGTLNHFARDVGVQSVTDTKEATEIGSAKAIDLGEVKVTNGEDTEQRWFINTASLGGYPEMVRLREKLQQRLSKWPAAAVALIRVLRRAQPMEILLNGKRASIWLLFVGNGTYAPKGFAPSRRPALNTGLLDVRYLRADLPYSRARFILAMITNTLRTSHVYRQHDMPKLEVVLLEGSKRIATDGEIGPLGDTFQFRSRQSALTIYQKDDTDVK
jgi:undecaprenyl-diphosphatase